MSDWPHIRLKYIAGLNERALPEGAPDGRAFRHVSDEIRAHEEEIQRRLRETTA